MIENGPLTETLEEMVDKYDIQTVLYSLSDIAEKKGDSDDSEYVGEEWNKIATVLDWSIEEINEIVE